MSDDDTKPTPRTPAPKTRSLREPQKISGVDPTDENDDEADVRESPRAERILVLNAADGARPAVRTVPTGRDAGGALQFDRRGSKTLVPGLNWVDAEAWEDAKYLDDKGKEQTAPGLAKNLGLRIRAGEIAVVELSDTQALIRAIGMTATRDMLLELQELEIKAQHHRGNRKGVLDAIDNALKGPSRRAMG